jgi:hypothetical protein
MTNACSRSRAGSERKRSRKWMKPLLTVGVRAQSAAVRRDLARDAQSISERAAAEPWAPRMDCSGFAPGLFLVGSNHLLPGRCGGAGDGGFSVLRVLSVASRALTKLHHHRMTRAEKRMKPTRKSAPIDWYASTAGGGACFSLRAGLVGRELAACGRRAAREHQR